MSVGQAASVAAHFSILAKGAAMSISSLASCRVKRASEAAALASLIFSALLRTSRTQHAIDIDGNKVGSPSSAASINNFLIANAYKGNVRMSSNKLASAPAAASYNPHASPFLCWRCG
jgi:hypothetical protein